MASVVKIGIVVMCNHVTAFRRAKRQANVEGSTGMSSLRDVVISDTLAKVHVTYVDRATCKFWNSRKDKDDVAIFTGFYWLKGREEGGPFKTRSSCLRDAYYRFVLKRTVPALGAGTVTAAHAPEPLKKLPRIKKRDLEAMAYAA